jgi:hypothetical protein
MDREAETTVPRGWLAAVVKLLNEMAGDGISMQDCEDPADLMCEIAEHLGVSDADDMWGAAVKALAAPEGSSAR